jgi:hypothetical protein
MGEQPFPSRATQLDPAHELLGCVGRGRNRGQLCHWPLPHVRPIPEPVDSLRVNAASNEWSKNFGQGRDVAVGQKPPCAEVQDLAETQEGSGDGLGAVACRNQFLSGCLGSSVHASGCGLSMQYLSSHGGRIAFVRTFTAMVWPTTIIAHRSLLLVPRDQFARGGATRDHAPWPPACVHDSLRSTVRSLSVIRSSSCSYLRRGPGSWRGTPFLSCHINRFSTRGANATTPT